MRRLACVLAAAAALSGCATHHASPTGQTTGPCPQTTPCTPERAYAVASDGDVVQLRPGIYQHITLPAGSKQVAFVGPATVRELDTDADNVAFVNIDFDGGFARNAVVENNGKALFKDDSIGNVMDEKGLLSGSDATGSRYQNVLFHDVRVTDSAVHNECVYSQTPYVQIVDSTFRDCATFDVFLTRGDWWNQPVYGNGTITGNRFYHSLRSTNPADWHYNELVFSGSLDRVYGWTVKNNWVETRTQGDATSPAVGGIGLDLPYEGGVRCGNTEPDGQLDPVWKAPC